MISFFLFTISVFCIFCIIYRLIKTKKAIQRQYPKGDYVLKILINKQVKNEIQMVLELMKECFINLITKLSKEKDLYNKWKKGGEAKIVLCGSSEEILSAYNNSIKKGILCVTHISKNNIPALVIIGPGLKAIINEFTNDFKLL